MIFLDSSYLIALIIKSDKYHPQAHKLSSILKNESILINNTVLTEVLNSFSTKNNPEDISKIANFLLTIENIDYLESEDYKKAVDLFKFYNQSINFSDCTILQTMEKMKVNTIVSFDSDFDKIKGIKRIYL